MTRYVFARGINYRAEQYIGGLSGVVIRNADDSEVAFMQDEEWMAIADQIDTIKPNYRFTIPQLVDLVLDCYDF